MAKNAPVEAKVKASTLVTFVVGLVVAILNNVQDDPGLLGPLPDWAELIIIAVVPALLTLLAGYKAPHSARPE